MIETGLKIIEKKKIKAHLFRTENSLLTVENSVQKFLCMISIDF